MDQSFYYFQRKRDPFWISTDLNFVLWKPPGLIDEIA